MANSIHRRVPSRSASAELTWLLVPTFLGTAALSVAVSSLASSSDPTTVGVVVGLVFSVVGIVMVLLHARAISPFSLIAIYFYCHIVLFVLRPAFASLFQASENIFLKTPNSDYFVLAQLVAGVGFLCVCIGYSIAVSGITAEQFGRQVTPLPDYYWERLRPLLWLVVVAGFGLYAGHILTVGWSSYWTGLVQGRSEELRESFAQSSGYLYEGLRFATGALVMLLLHAAIKRDRRSTVIAGIFLAASIVPTVMSGSRAGFIPVVIAVLLVLAERRAKILRLRYVLFWLPALFLVGFVAPRIWRDNLARGGSFVESIGEAATSEAVGEGFFGGFDTAMVDAFSIQVAAQESGSLLLQGGRTYLYAVSSFVPRSIWPGKPESVDETLNSHLFPLSHSRGTGFAFAMYSEPYFNFGLVGVILICVLFGLLLGWLTRLSRRPEAFVPTFFYVMLATQMFSIVRGSLSFSSRRFLILVMPVVICLIVVHLGGRAKRRHALPTGSIGDIPLSGGISQHRARSAD